jgi:hypothetical protein
MATKRRKLKEAMATRQIKRAVERACIRQNRSCHFVRLMPRLLFPDLVLESKAPADFYIQKQNGPLPRHLMSRARTSPCDALTDHRLHHLMLSRTTTTQCERKKAHQRTSPTKCRRDDAILWCCHGPHLNWLDWGRWFFFFVRETDQSYKSKNFAARLGFQGDLPRGTKNIKWE